MEKNKLKKTLLFSGLWRSVYGNMFQVGGVRAPDVKVYDKKEVFYKTSYDINNLKYDYLSSSDNSFKTVKSIVLEKQFKNKTIYEA